MKFFKKLIASFFTKDPRDIAPQEMFQIVGIVNQLPWHPTRKWAKRGLAQIKKIVVHQAYASYTKTTLEGINNYHITPSENNHLSPNGAPHIAYHYGIVSDGTVYQTNFLSNATWHTAGHNTSSIGILVLGDFHGPQRVGADKHPTHKQLSSLEKLLDHLKAHPDLTIGSKEIYGHKDFGKKNCPGIAISRFLNEYNANI